MPGPPPKAPEGRRRRNATVPMVQLPPEGRPAPAPSWPFSSGEPSLWADLWTTPQAAAWDRMGFGVRQMVARYVLLLTGSDITHPAVSGEARQLEDRLGLNPMALLRLRWEIAPDEIAEQRAAPPVRSKLRAVDPTAVND